MKRRHSFGTVGFAEMGRISSKNNRALVSKRKKGTKLASDGKTSFQEHKKASPELLGKIRSRLRNERRRKNFKLLTLFAFVFVAIVLIIFSIEMV